MEIEWIKKMNMIGKTDRRGGTRRKHIFQMER